MKDGKQFDAKEPAREKTPQQNKPDWMQPQEDGNSKASFWRDRFVPFWTKNKKRNLKIFLGVLAAVIVAAVVIVFLYVNNMLNLIGTENPDGPQGGVEDPIYDEQEFAEMDGIKDADSLKDLLKTWATNGGEKYASRNVINVLLIGQDDGRSDSMILASINRKTDQITLASFFRDSYSYIDYNGQDRYTKINAAYQWGGADLLIETLENNFKIEIDYYVSINFENFSKAIDALGGIRVDVQQYESDYIRRTSSHKNFPVGENVLLNGDEALVFSRIRKSDADSDISRTRRQRQVISALIAQTKNASLGQLNSMVNKMLPYVNTNIPKTEILSLGTQAILQGWMNYPINTMTAPSEQYRRGQYINGTSFIIVDYQAAARELQMALYGNSNIPDEDHVSPFDLDLSYSGGSGSVSGGGTTAPSVSEPVSSNQQETEPVSIAEEPTWPWWMHPSVSDPSTTEPGTEAPSEEESSIPAGEGEESTAAQGQEDSTSGEGNLF